MNRLSVACPHIGNNEKKYVVDALESTWISSTGKYITMFEDMFADFCGVRYAIATNNGTTALHLALVAMGLKAGDEVLVPTVTYIATANAVRYCGATPVFVDSEPYTLTIDVEDAARKITSRTKGIIPVHLYGQPARMKELTTLAQAHGMWVLEDAAEAHGAEYHGKRVGSWGTCAAFSFFGNKIITTGEGGMVTTNDSNLAEKLRIFRGQGMDPARRYWFPVVGYNYRMTNIIAALGVAQMEKAEESLQARRTLADWYDEALAPLRDRVHLPQTMNNVTPVCWLYTVYLRSGSAHERDFVMSFMDAQGIETRPVFYPMHVMPPYEEKKSFPVADEWAPRGINLPTWQGMTQENVRQVAQSLTQALEQL